MITSQWSLRMGASEPNPCRIPEPGTSQHFTEEELSDLAASIRGCMMLLWTVFSTRKKTTKSPPGMNMRENACQPLTLFWMRFSMATALAMFTLLPTWPLQTMQGHPPQRPNFWETMVSVWPACPTPRVQHAGENTCEPRETRGIVVHKIIVRRGVNDFMYNYSTSLSWFTGIFTSLCHLFSCWNNLPTCRSDHFFSTNFRFHHGFCFNFTIFTKCSLKVGKETKPGRKIPGKGKWGCHVWTPLAVVGWSVRRYA